MRNLIFVFVLYSTSAISQIVCDSITKIPIKYANIISNNNYGTITNEHGVFTLDYFYDFISLEFSHIAYQSKKLNYSYFNKLDTVFLKPSIISLDEIILENFNAQDTVQKSINQISDNYSFEPFNLYGFYRESIVEDNVGVAITEVSFLSINEEVKNEQIYEAEIIRGRRSENYSSFGLDIIGGIYNIITRGDMVRQKIRLFDLKNISKYNYKYSGSIENFGNVTYIIEFNPSDDDIYNNSYGQLFIDSKTLAITQFNIKKDEDKVKKILKSIKPEIFNSKDATYLLTGSDAIIRYKKHKNFYYLSFITVTNNKMGILQNESLDYDINAKLIITNINTENIKKVKTNYNIKKGFNNQVKKIPNLEYWNESNTLFFSEREKKILNDIKNVEN